MSNTIPTPKDRGKDYLQDLKDGVKEMDLNEQEQLVERESNNTDYKVTNYIKEGVSNKMKKLFQSLGTLFIISGFIFMLVDSMIVTGTKGENFSRDLLGFPIPQTPEWTSFIPILGTLFRIVFELFSLHGLVGTVIFGILLYIGFFLMKLSDKNKQ